MNVETYKPNFSSFEDIVQISSHESSGILSQKFKMGARMRLQCATYSRFEARLSPKLQRYFRSFRGPLIDGASRICIPYILIPETCEKICEILGDFSNPDTAVVVGWPGPGFLSAKLVKHGVHHLHLMEPQTDFYKHLMKLHQDHPMVKVYNEKLVVQQELLEETSLKAFTGVLQSDKYSRIKVVLVAHRRSTLKSFIKNITSDASPCANKNVEFYLVMPSKIGEELLSCKAEKIGRSITQQWSLFMQSEFMGTLSASTMFPHFERKTMHSTWKPEAWVVRSTARPLLLQRITPNERRFLILFSSQFNMKSSDYVVESLEKWAPGVGFYLVGERISVFTRFNQLTRNQYLDVFKIFFDFTTHQSPVWKLFDDDEIGY